MAGRPSLSVHHARLAVPAETIGLDECRERPFRVRPAGEERQAVGAVTDVGMRLGGDRPDARPCPRDDGSNGQEPGLDRHAQVAGHAVPRDDGVRHDRCLLSVNPAGRRAEAARSQPAVRGRDQLRPGDVGAV